MKETYLILAINDPAYLRFAVNLAISIRASGDDRPITLVKDNAPFAVDVQGMFDVIRTVPVGSNPFYLKTRLPEYTDAARTLYLDADCFVVGKTGEIWDELAGRSFAPFVRKIGDLETLDPSAFYWANPRKAAGQFGITAGSWFEINSSILYFEESAAELFKTAEYLYAAEPFRDYKHEGFWQYPDELAFELAMLIERWDYNPAPLLYLHPDGRRWSAREIEEWRTIRPIFTLNGAGMTTHPKMWQYYNRQGVRMARKIGKKWNRMAVEDKHAFKARGSARYHPIRGGDRPEWFTEKLSKYQK